jgi:hypothetical protein
MGGFRGGGFRGGFGGFRGGFGGFRGGFGRGWWGPGWGWGWGGGFWPYYGSGLGWGYPYYGWGYPSYGYGDYPYSGYSYPYAYSDSYPTDSNGYASRDASSAPVYSGTVQTSCLQYSGRPVYLIKLTYQDKVWAARDYWYTPGTLNFVTLQGELNKTPIETIDHGVTFQLNSQCGVNFQLPK